MTGKARCDGVHGVGGQYAAKRRDGPLGGVARVEAPYEAPCGDAGGLAVSISPGTALDPA